MTVAELVQFVLLHRRGNAFKDYSVADIGCEISRAMGNDLLCVVFDSGTQNIIGIVTAIHHDADTIRVRNALAIQPNVLPLFIKKLQQLYPDKQLVTYRRGKFVRYNTEKLIKKIYGLT